MPERRRVVRVALAVAITMAGAGAVSADAPDRQAQLLHLLKHDCGSCHGLTMKGGLGPPLLPQTLDGKPDDALAAAILAGRPGTAMPPWAFAMTAAEAAWLVERLRQGNIQ